MDEEPEADLLTLQLLDEIPEHTAGQPAPPASPETTPPAALVPSVVVTPPVPDLVPSAEDVARGRAGVQNANLWSYCQALWVRFQAEMPLPRLSQEAVGEAQARALDRIHAVIDPVREELSGSELKAEVERVKTAVTAASSQASKNHQAVAAAAADYKTRIAEGAGPATYKALATLGIAKAKAVSTDTVLADLQNRLDGLQREAGAVSRQRLKDVHRQLATTARTDVEQFLVKTAKDLEPVLAEFLQLASFARLSAAELSRAGFIADLEDR
jgi:hypothetical protein